MMPEKLRSSTFASLVLGSLLLTPSLASAAHCSLPVRAHLVAGDMGSGVWENERSAAIGAVPSASAKSGKMVLVRLAPTAEWHRKYHADIIAALRKQGQLTAADERYWGHDWLAEYHDIGGTKTFWLDADNVVVKSMSPYTLRDGPTLCTYP